MKCLIIEYILSSERKKKRRVFQPNHYILYTLGDTIYFNHVWCGDKSYISGKRRNPPYFIGLHTRYDCVIYDWAQAQDRGGVGKRFKMKFWMCSLQLERDSLLYIRL